jgi:outer membrane receptor protein involved in Fe transport
MSANNLAWMPSYWQADLRLGVKAQSWGLEAYVTNLFNDESPRSGTSTVDYGYFDLNSFQLPRGYLVTLAPRRRFGLQASFKY